MIIKNGCVYKNYQEMNSWEQMECRNGRYLTSIKPKGEKYWYYRVK